MRECAEQVLATNLGCCAMSFGKRAAGLKD
jgi:hypothetical protein